jgi:hypothetical protein
MYEHEANRGDEVYGGAAIVLRWTTKRKHYF